MPAETIVELAKLFAVEPHHAGLAAGRSSASTTASNRTGCWSRWPRCWARSACRAAASASRYHYANGGAPSHKALALRRIPDGGSAVEGAAWMTEGGAFSIPVSRVVEMLENPGGTLDFNGTQTPSRK